MIKYILSLLLILNCIPAIAESKMAVCSLIHVSNIKKIAEAHSNYDKNRHCSVSCMLTLKCPAVDVLLAGYFKELADLLGYGEPDKEDLKANKLGIDLARTRAATTNNACLRHCDLYY
jgi:hypothetical protein